MDAGGKWRQSFYHGDLLLKFKVSFSCNKMFDFIPKSFEMKSVAMSLTRLKFDCSKL